MYGNFSTFDSLYGYLYVHAETDWAPLDTVRENVLTASKSAWYVSKVIENSCGPGVV